MMVMTRNENKQLTKIRGTDNLIRDGYDRRGERVQHAADGAAAGG